MSDNNIEEDFSFEAICLCTNYENFSSILVLKQYFMSTNCSDIKYITNNNVTFKHTLIVGNKNKKTNIECKHSYIEMTPVSKNVTINDEIDCFIIFFDLEYYDSLSELYKIIKIISDLGITDKTFYIIGIYTNEKNKKSDDKYENAIKKYLEDFSINDFDLSQVNMEKSEEFANKIDKITIECLQNKKLLNNYTKDLQNDKSKSQCLII